MFHVIKLFESMGAWRKGHFVLSSGRHGGDYLEKHDVLASPPLTELIAKQMAVLADSLAQKNGTPIATVAGIATCGITLAQRTAFFLTELNDRKEVAGIFADRSEDKELVFRRGDWDTKYVQGKSILIVDDIATSGASIKRMIRLVQSAGGQPLAAAVMINRNPAEVTEASLGIPLIALGSVQIPSYEEINCPLCQAGVPIDERPGHGKEYLMRKQNQTAPGAH